MTEQIENVGLSSKAMLVNLNICGWSGKKTDKNVTRKVHSDYGASEDSGRYNKSLVAKSALETIKKAVNEARTFHYEQTLPWLNNGYRILPVTNFDHYTAQMRELNSKWETAVKDFIGNYESFVEQARYDLNGMFNEKDYPASYEISRKFKFDTDIQPLPDADDFRCQITDTEIKRIKAAIEGKAQAAAETAKKDLFDRLFKVTQKIAETLPAFDNGEVKRFSDTLITNVERLVDLLPRLNIDENPEIEKLRQTVKSKLIVDPQQLRESKKMRKDLAADAEQILRKMQGVF